MRCRRLFVIAFVFSTGTVLATAQESVRLQFEVVKDSSTVARPEVSMKSGSPGRIEVPDVGTFAFTPTLRNSEVAIAFDIRSAGKQFTPRLVISPNELGTISWVSATTAESFALRVSWLR
jgi:hypothetical protein